jgi:hypothetical protein
MAQKHYINCSPRRAKMRKFIIAIAAGASALAVATPAAAQYYQGPARAPYGNAYGYNNYGQIRSLQQRLNNVERQINRFDNRRGGLSNREARELREDARDLQRKLARLPNGGISQREVQNLEYRIQRLEQRVWREARDGNRGNRGNWNDRDRDGRIDRYEDDRGYRRD